jgi:hypothetical protein
MKISVPISLGELYDKISILEIKLANIRDTKKLANISKEYNELMAVASQYPIDEDLYKKLKDINKELWDIEDGIREEERNKDWGEDFVQFARRVYFTNDKRSEVKKEINVKYGSDFIEEKSYEAY